MPIFEDILQELKEIKSLLSKEAPVAAPMKFPIWKTMEVGGMSKKELIAVIEKKGMTISYYAKQMILSDEFKITKKAESMEFVKLAVIDLFNDSDIHTTDEIFEKAKTLGLELCPAEVGPHLRLKITDQSMGEWFNIAMKSIADAHRDPYVFRVGRGGGGSWLDGYFAGPTGRWYPACRIVFRIPRK